MGGNVIINGQAADRIPTGTIHARAYAARVALDFVRKFNELYDVWQKDAAESLSMFSGSARHMVNRSGISTKEFCKVKPTVGDIDLMVPVSKTGVINRIFANASACGLMVGELTFIGHKLSGDQTITLWKDP